MEKLWTDWKKFLIEELSEIPVKEGVYQLRCVDKAGLPIKVSRLTGDDSEGIIYIGSSTNLKIRIKGFWKTIQNRDISRHAAGWTFCSFGYDSIFRPDMLQFRYKVTKSITTSEFDLMIDYRKRFMDLPPLNSNRPTYPRDWKNRMQKVFGKKPL